MHKRLIPLVLAHVREGEPIDGRTRLQKMVFVVQQELREEGELNQHQCYKFFPYDYGPFSKELAESIDQMIDQGIIEESKTQYDEKGNIKYFYELEPDGKELVEQQLEENDMSSIVDKTRDIKQRFNEDLSLPDVIDNVYSEYPEYAENSIY